MSALLSNVPVDGDGTLFGDRQSACRTQALQLDHGLRRDLSNIRARHVDRLGTSQTGKGAGRKAGPDLPATGRQLAPHPASGAQVKQLRAAGAEEVFRETAPRRAGEASFAPPLFSSSVKRPDKRSLAHLRDAR
jgi:hypothetical protein